jgi:hypothetical protein
MDWVMAANEKATRCRVAFPDESNGTPPLFLRADQFFELGANRRLSLDRIVDAGCRRDAVVT